MKKTHVIEFKGVCKHYPHLQILEHINLQIRAGEFFGLVGVNGAGKTTLIKCLLDLCEIDKGSIQLCGVAHTHHHARTPLTFLPEQFVPPYYLTGQHFLAYMAKLQRRVYDSKHAHEICQTLDLAVSALEQSVRDYSKGMTQKLGLAACFLSNKRLLVLDEPMNGLDPKARALLKHYLLTLKAKETTIFFSTHLLADVEALCDRMAILHEGRLPFIGTPSECCTTFSAENLELAYLNCIENL
ncbi:ABC transporter ATP-binding protein [Candidatus Marithioploca araucensis]|jgi:ABC-2 type transport system ATP-binding protein|uniref:ABC transporter ATP-binding protein n=1 Tax=Candidatus Marithioploca araucensis TaxID=70273 RepID=A0ABT7VTS9_9GAMM|nr:ABC transporter ATP-binding protein [Candidatus Marithioploca araucensis]